MRVLITILIISITNVFVYVSGGVPGPNDPDTYPGKTIRWNIKGIGIVEQTLVGVAKKIIPTKNNIDIIFHSRKNPLGVQILWNDTSACLRKTDFNPSKPTLFVTHGWLSDRFSEICPLIRNTAITTKDVNVFIIDWGKYSKAGYISARSSVDFVGKSVGEFVKKLVDAHGLKLVKTTIVGHSLGAHVAGLAGTFLGGKVETVIGLDPAWPLFYYSKPGQRLNKNSGKFVQVVHTNGKMLGFPYSIGTSDYYANGGTNQIGCFLDVTGYCSHTRAYKIYAESIKTGNFVSWKCDSYKRFKEGHCKNNPKSYMGTLLIDRRASGDYYFDTKYTGPFAKGA